jgi:hypothetical protein
MSKSKSKESKIRFNDIPEIKYYDNNRNLNPNINPNQETNDSDSGTDYEEENINPVELFRNLIKNSKKSFGVEEYGNDMESNNELKRKIETVLDTLKNGNKLKNIPEFKPESKKDPFINSELNDIPKILGNEKDKDLQPCDKCSELMQVNYNPCTVCSRETVDVRCLNCYPNILELCSEKCKDIYEGNVSVIEISNYDDKPIIVIEDDGQNMVLTVTNHKLFYEELNEKDSLMINKPCPNCNESEYEPGNGYNADNDSDSEEDKKVIGVIPVKCCLCNSNYSYLVVCGICYNKSGIKYLCDNCEYE